MDMDIDELVRGLPHMPLLMSHGPAPASAGIHFPALLTSSSLSSSAAAAAAAAAASSASLVSAFALQQQPPPSVGSGVGRPRKRKASVATTDDNDNSSNDGSSSHTSSGDPAERAQKKRLSPVIAMHQREIPADLALLCTQLCDGVAEYMEKQQFLNAASLAEARAQLQQQSAEIDATMQSYLTTKTCHPINNQRLNAHAQKDLVFEALCLTSFDALFLNVVKFSHGTGDFEHRVQPFFLSGALPGPSSTMPVAISSGPPFGRGGATAAATAATSPPGAGAKKRSGALRMRPMSGGIVPESYIFRFRTRRYSYMHRVKRYNREEGGGLSPEAVTPAEQQPFQPLPLPTAAEMAAQHAVPAPVYPGDEFLGMLAPADLDDLDFLSGATAGGDLVVTAQLLLPSHTF
jgi:hypothetical protein